MAYWKHTPAERAQLGLRDGLIRFSCGLEDASDLLSDVEAAVRTATAHGDAQYLTESYEVRARRFIGGSVGRSTCCRCGMISL